MTNSAGHDPERTLAIGYASPPAREGLAALFALDDTLANILRRTRDPMVGQMRLTWWHEALSALDTTRTGADPVLRALADTLLPRGVNGATLAAMIDGWEALLDLPLDVAAMRRHGEARGAALFRVAGQLLDTKRDPLATAGAGWALADLAGHLADAQAAEMARGLARPLLAAAVARRWSRAGRTLGALTHLARMNMVLPPGTAPPTGSPRRVARLLVHRLSGV